VCVTMAIFGVRKITNRFFINQEGYKPGRKLSRQVEFGRDEKILITIVVSLRFPYKDDFNLEGIAKSSFTT